jgi:BTB/POZ domain
MAASALPTVLELNIGGKRFDISRSAVERFGREDGTQQQLQPDNNFFRGLLSAERWGSLARDSRGRVYIERNGDLAKPIIELMRTGRWDPASHDEKLLQEECDFYQVFPPQQLCVSDETIRRWCAQAAERELAKRLEGSKLAGDESDSATFRLSRLWKRCCKSSRKSVRGKLWQKTCAHYYT